MKKRISAVFFTVCLLLSEVFSLPVYAEGGLPDSLGTILSTYQTLIAINSDHSVSGCVAGSFSQGEMSLSSVNGTDSSGEICHSREGGRLLELAPDLPAQEPAASGPAVLSSLSGEAEDYAVGDTFTLCSVLCDTDTVNMQCLYVGTHCTVWGSTDQAEQIRLPESAAKQIADAFDENYDEMANCFGSTSADVDQDGRIAIMCYDLKGSDNDTYSADGTGLFSGTYTGGYFNYLDLAVQVSSSQGCVTAGENSKYYTMTGGYNTIDCIHIDTFPSMGDSYASPFGHVEWALSTLFHEYQHMLNFSAYVAGGAGAQTPTFLNEAFSMAAEHLLFGSDSTADRVENFNDPDTYVPGTPLTYWCSTLSSYANSYLFGQYIRTQYAQQTGTDGNSIYRQILAKATSQTQAGDYLGIIADLLCTEEADLVKDFWTACYLKDDTGAHGFYGESWADSISPVLSSASSRSGIYSGGAKFYDTSKTTLTLSGASDVLLFRKLSSDGTVSGFHRLASGTAMDAKGRIYLTGAAVKDGTDLTFLSDGIGIDAVNFPDENFRTFISEQLDTDGDGELSAEEISACTELRCPGLEIADLKGIGFFTGLTLLDCSGNLLSSLDLSGNSLLQTLNCGGNRLTQLDLTANTALTSVSAENQTASAAAYRLYGGKITVDLSACVSSGLLGGVSGIAVLYSEDDIRTDIAVLNSSTGLVSIPPQYDSGNVLSVPKALYYTLTPGGTGGFSMSVRLNLTVQEAPLTGDIPIDEDHFPDTGFRSFAESCDTNGDGVLSDQERDLITDIYLYDKQISSVQGVEYFPKITTFGAPKNQLTELDLSTCPDVSYLECSGNCLTSLDVSRCTKLSTLYCYNNQLTELNVTRCTPLTNLSCFQNQLTSLDVTRNTALGKLYCGNNQLTELDVSKNTQLTSLSCYGNQLSSLDVGGFASLTVLECFQNSLTSLNVSGCSSLQYLMCSDNRLRSLDVTDCTALVYLDCADNQLTSVNAVIRSELKTFSADGQKRTVIVSAGEDGSAVIDLLKSGLVPADQLEDVTLQCVYFEDGSSLSAGSLSCDLSTGVITIPATYADSVLLTPESLHYYITYTGTVNQFRLTAELDLILADGIPIDSGHFPDDTFRSYVSEEFDADGDGALSAAELNDAAEISCQGSQITNMKGLELFPALRVLCCADNELTELDLSANTLLERVDCSGNHLTYLDISALTALTALSADGQTASITAGRTEDGVIETTLCGLIPWILLSSVTGLQAVYSETDIRSGAEVLSYDLSWGIVSIAPQRDEGGTLLVPTALLYTLTLTGAARSFSIEVSLTLKVDNGILITGGRFPDSVFRSYVETNFDKDGSGILSSAELGAVTEIVCEDKQIGSLQGIELFTGLTKLNCLYNNLTELDVSKNTALTELNCGVNKLTELDVSKNTALQKLDCFNDGLTSLDISCNPRLSYLYCGGNLLNRLDLSGNTSLSQLYCSDSSLLTGIILDNCTSLTILECYENAQMTELSVKGCSALSVLRCYGGGLTSLSLDGCTSLTLLACYENAQMTELSAKGCSALSVLRCYGGGLTSLSLDGCTKLENLDCRSNRLTELKVDENTALVYLYCANNVLTSLDLGGHTALTQLICSGNQLSTLNVDGDSALQWVDCRSNRLTELKADENTALVYLYCQDNMLTSLNTGSNTALTYLDCSGNRLTGIDVSGNTALTHLDCSGNRLMDIDLSKNTSLTFLSASDQEVSGTAHQTLSGNFYIYLSDLLDSGRLASLSSYMEVEFSDGSVISSSYFYYDQSSGRVLIYASHDSEGNLRIPGEFRFTAPVSNSSYKMSFNMSLTAVMAEGIAIDEKNFPDEHFRNYVWNLDPDHDGILTDSERNSITKISCGSGGISSLQGIGFFTKLTSLSCEGNKLTDIDLSLNTALTSVTADAQTQSVSALLLMSDNVVRVDLSQWINSDRLKNVSNLQVIYSTEDIRSGASVITYDSVGGLVSIAPQYNDSGTLLTPLKISYDLSLDHGFTLSAVLQLTLYIAYPISAAYFPDENFRSCVSESLDPDGDGVLTEEERNAAESIDCSGKQIASLKGVELFPKLTSLYCGSNLLTELDLSQNTALTTLYCYSNLLTELDLSQNTALRSLSCYGNRLITLDLSHNTALTALSADGQTPFTDVTAVQNADGVVILELSSLMPAELLPLLTSVQAGYSGAYTSDNVEYSAETGTVSISPRYDEGDTLLSPSAVRFSVPLDGPSENLTLGIILGFTVAGPVSIDEEHFPDANFRNYLSSAFDKDSDGILTAEERNTESIDCSGKQIASLKGVELFTNLKYLYCCENQLTELNVSKNPELMVLCCYNNRLSALDVSCNPELTELYCDDNQLTELDISRNTSLEYLSVSDNQLAYLDVSELIPLSSLYAGTQTFSGEGRQYADGSSEVSLYEYIPPDQLANVSSVKALFGSSEVTASCSGSGLVTISALYDTDGKPQVPSAIKYTFTMETKTENVGMAVTMNLEVSLSRSEAAAAAEELILSIGTVTYDTECWERIRAAREQYDALSEEERAEVTVCQVLTEAEEAFLLLEAEDDLRFVVLYSAVEGGTASVAPVSGGGAYYSVRGCDILASEADGYTFAGWYKDYGTDSQESYSDERAVHVTPSESITLTAVYRPKEDKTYSVNVIADSYQITAQENNRGRMNTWTFAAGTVVTITFTGTSANFSHWEDGQGHVLGRKASYTFVVGRDLSILASQ